MDINGVIEVKKAIVHILNTKDDKHVISDYEIQLDEKLNSLIVGHINKANISKAKIFVKFNDEENNLVRNSILKIFEDENLFVEESRKISKQLYTAMKGTNASAANLLLVYFLCGGKKSFAIVKLDFSNNYYTESEDVDGKTKVKVNVKGNGFSETQKLRKCALINYDTINCEEKIFSLLDTQVGGVSDYFRCGFLDCELLNDSRNNTRKLVKTINKYINNKFMDKSNELVKKTYLFSSIIENVSEFKIDDLNTIFIEEEVDEIKSIVSKEKIDFTFKIDKDFAEKMFNNITIETQNGISLKAKHSLFNETDIVLSQPDEEGRVDIILKKIKIDGNKICQ